MSPSPHMPTADVEILFPVKGLHEGTAYKDQPPLTTPNCLNVVPNDPVTDRECGASRPGTAKYNASQVSGSSAVVEGLAVTRIDGRVAYTPVESEDPAQGPGIVKQVVLPSRLDCLDIVCDEQSNLFVAAGTSGGGTGINCVCKYNSSLQLVWAFALPMERHTDVVKSIRLDGDGGIYAVITGSVSGPTKIYRLEETGLAAFPVRFSWSDGIDAPNNGWWGCCAVGRGCLYAVELTPNDGVFLHRYDGIDEANPRHTWGVRIRETGGDEAYCIDIADDGAALVGIVDPTNPPDANGKIEKFGPMKPDETTPAGATDAGSLAIWSYTEEGVGQAIVNKTLADGSAYLYTHGFGSGGPYIRKLRDDGASVTSIASYSTTAATHFKGATSVAVDDDGNIYVTTDDAGGTDVILEKVNAALNATLWSVTGDELATAGLDAIAVAIDPKYADSGGASPIPEFIYVGTVADATNHVALHKLRVANVATSVGSPRETFNICVTAGGAIRKVTSSSVATPAGSPSLDATARWIMAVSGLNRVLFTDGRQYKSMDLLAGPDGTVSDWTPWRGEIPRRGRLLEIYQNCAVVAGFEENPHQWAFSAVGDFDDWDFYPADEGVGSAVIGAGSNAGLCPDKITAMCRWYDDLMIFGGDKSIQRMSGHPRGEGRFDEITDQTGMAWGRPFCKDPRGALYFVGSEGGFYRLIPGDTPAEISLDPLSDRFRDIDVGANRFSLVWDHKLKGIWIFITPYTAGAATHYFWSARQNAFWPIQFAATGGAHNPMAAWILNADAPGDRTILLGCADGYVRRMVENGDDDDGTAIDSYVDMVYIAPRGDEHRLNRWRGVLGAGSNDVTLSVYGLEQPDSTTLPSASFSATLSAGRNDEIHEPVRGNALVIRLRNQTVDRRWSLESLVAASGFAGRSRNR